MVCAFSGVERSDSQSNVFIGTVRVALRRRQVIWRPLHPMSRHNQTSQVIATTTTTAQIGTISVEDTEGRKFRKENVPLMKWNTPMPKSSALS
jgi:hypothetical protein